MTAPATIDSQYLSDMLGSATPPRVLDVRSPGEFETAHIAGAYNVPLGLLREHRDEIIEHLDEDVVLVCRSGQRGAQRWDLERQVRLVAGSIVLTSILGSIAAPKLKWVAGAIGGGLTFAALSNTCAMGMLLSKLPYNRGAACDAPTIVAQLVDANRADRKAS